MKFRPCIDLHQGVVKQIVGGTLRDNQDPLTNFIATQPPSYYAKLYQKDGLTGGHVIMLGPGNEEAAREALGAWPGNLQVGGGINSSNAKSWLEAGASGVIVTSYVFRDGVVDFSRLNEMLQAVGEEHLILDLSCRKREDRYWVTTNRWQQFTDVAICSENLDRLANYCSEFLIHAADVEGLRQGVDVTLARLLGDSVKIPTTYAGGVRSLEDMNLIKEAGRSRLDVTVGSALDLFGGSLSYQEVVRLNNQWNKENTNRV